MDTKMVAGPQKAPFPLLWKISLLVGITLALVAAVVGAVLGNYFGKVLETEGRARAKAISVTLASALVEMPESAIASTIHSVKKDSELAYIEVVGPSGNLLAHTFEGKAPAQDLRQLRESEKVSEVLIDGVRYVDVPAPVMTGALVHVGLDPGRIAARLREAQIRLFGVTALAMVLAIGIAWLLVRQIISPLKRLTHLTSRILEGDLTQRVDVTSSDEIGELAAAFGAMVEKLKQVVGALQDSVRLLKQAGDDLGTSTSEQSETITRQATALQETQVTAQEIKQTSLLAAQKAEAVLKLTEKADEVSSSGETAIESSLGGLTDIRAQVDEIAHKITQLSERTQQIGGITQTVKDLADQSNMLALNAAIEAVRSGEHGKGFAVVAREIRLLADQSIRATSRVREVLGSLGSAIRAAVSLTEQGAQRMETGLVQVRTSGETFRELSNSVARTREVVRDIAAAVDQQHAGIDAIFGAVTEVTGNMGQAQTRLSGTVSATAEVKAVSNEILAILESYRV